jgi:hypothetical protein
MRTFLWTRLALAVVTCLAALMPSRVLYAGGWATFTLDHVPGSPRAGEQIDLGFVARAHGRTPIDLPAGDVTFVFTNRATGESRSASAAPSGLAAGHHQAAVVLPTAGTWDWELHPSWYPPVKFLPLVVLPAVARGVPVIALTPLIVVAARSLPGAVTGALLPGLASGLWPSGAIPLAPGTDSLPPTARGKALFIAKGCIACHYHGELPNGNSVEIGPDLTHYQGSVEFLHLWLADPPAVKPMTAMPNLGLQTAEIDALAAFLAQQ